MGLGVGVRSRKPSAGVEWRPQARMRSVGRGLGAMLLIQKWAKEEGPVNEKQNKSSEEPGQPGRKTKKNQEGKEGDGLFSALLTLFAQNKSLGMGPLYAGCKGLNNEGNSLLPS